MIRNLVDEKERKITEGMQVASKPTEDKCFIVNPMAIAVSKFHEKRKDPQQEWTRKNILEAFAELRKHPEKYGRLFKTTMPKKTWSTKKVTELISMAQNIGDHIADWVEQSLEWAQRIDNGETWEVVCNEPDNSKWTRLFIWKSGCPRLVGGLKEVDATLSSTDVMEYDLWLDEKLKMTVPNVVFYD